MSSDPAHVQYIALDLTPGVLARVRNVPTSDNGVASLARRAAPASRLGVGDLLKVTVFEASAGGLFVPNDAGARPGNYVDIPAQEIDRNGTIAVPFAGRIMAAGRNPADVERTIEARLRNRAIEPQAVVTLQEARSGLVSVTGDVHQSVRFALSRSGERLLDAISRAGGPRDQGYESYVTLQRGNQRAKIYFNRLVSDPGSNVFLYPGDTIVLSRETRSFMALGASGANGQINFDNETLTLAQAVGKAGGILDSRGDPSQVFLYRMEDKRVVADLGYDAGSFPGSTVPLVYRVNMREPDGFFLGTKFPMRDQDILFVSNAPTTDIAKVLGLVQPGAYLAADAATTRLAFRN